MHYPLVAPIYRDAFSYVNNTVLNAGVGGDTMRDIDKGGVKTPVSIIDIGGSGAENLVTAGQTTMANSLPVVIASNQTAVPSSNAAATQADGHSATIGATTDASSTNTLVGLLKAIKAFFTAGTGSRLDVNAYGAAGDVASGAADSGNPIKIGAKASTNEPTAVTNGQRVNLFSSLVGKLIILFGAAPADTWSYPAPAGGLVNTTGVTAKAAAGAGIRNYITSAQIINSHPSIGTEVVINDGAAGTTLARVWAQFGGGGASLKFDPPLKGTANTLVEIKEITATAATGVIVNLQGYVSAEG